MSSKEKEFMVEFIELHKTFPCLWKFKSKEYSDRNAKSQAYDILVEKMNTVDKNANRETVVKKINSIRTTYRKELKKVIDSERPGTGAEDVYVPHLWYYELLNFLQDQEITRRTVSNIDEDYESQSSESLEVQSIVDNSSQPGTPQSVISEPRTPRPISQASSREVKRRNDKCDEVLDVIQKRFKVPPEVDEKFTNIGKAWASKLRELPHEQMIHAEKLIIEVFYEAQLGSLHRYCSLQVQPQQQAYLQPGSSHSQQRQSFLQSGPSFSPQMPLSSQPVPSYQHQIEPHSQRGTYYHQHTRPFSQQTESHKQQSAHSRNIEHDEHTDTLTTSASNYFSTFSTD